MLDKWSVLTQQSHISVHTHTRTHTCVFSYTPCNTGHWSGFSHEVPSDNGTQPARQDEQTHDEDPCTGGVQDDRAHQGEAGLWSLLQCCLVKCHCGGIQYEGLCAHIGSATDEITRVVNSKTLI